MMSDPQTPFTILRLPKVYGPGDRSCLFDDCKRMDDGREGILRGERKSRWRWTRGYVENVAAAIALAVTDARSANRIYNLGEGDAISESEWARSIGLAAGWRGEVVAVPEDALPQSMLEPYRFEQHLVADTNRFRKELGYEEETPRQEALRRSIEWERANPPADIDLRRFDYAAEELAAISLIDLGNCPVNLTGGIMQTLWQDLRYGARMLLKKPGFTFVAVITLGLGIGANTTMFSVVNGMLLRPLPFNDPERLVHLGEESPKVGMGAMGVSFTDFTDWRARSRSFKEMALYEEDSFTLASGNATERAERIEGARVTASLFPLLGVKTAQDRHFLEEEDKPGAAPAAIIGYGLWQRRFGGDPG